MPACAPGQDGAGALVAHLFRRESARLLATLVASLGSAHLALAEDAVQDAMVAALRTWPIAGIPDRPAAWLQTVARHRALDRLRGEARRRGSESTLTTNAELGAASRALGRAIEQTVCFEHELTDEQLRLLFLCCHPALSADAQACLTLKLVSGLGVRAIARAFLAEPAAIAQRLVRAKARLCELGVRFDLPDLHALASRAAVVRDVIYLAFNEGYGAAEGDALVREDVCAEAVRLAEECARHPVTAGPAACALAALLCLQASRLPARVDENGELVRLADQDRSLWDRALVSRGFAHLRRAIAGDVETRHHVEAAIAAEHARSASWECTDWPRILALYDRLLALTPSPIARLHRAVAVAEVSGASVALRELEALAVSGALDRYYLFHAIRGDVLLRERRVDEARHAFSLAARLPCSAPERRFLEKRAAAI